jgi:hypothetical protein
MVSNQEMGERWERGGANDEESCEDNASSFPPEIQLTLRWSQVFPRPGGARLAQRCAASRDLSAALTMHLRAIEGREGAEGSWRLRQRRRARVC